MKMKLLIMSLIAVANVYVAIRFRQPMAFVMVGVIAVAMIYCYLTESKSDKSK